MEPVSSHSSSLYVILHTLKTVPTHRQIHSKHITPETTIIKNIRTYTRVFVNPKLYTFYMLLYCIASCITYTIIIFLHIKRYIYEFNYIFYIVLILKWFTLH